MNYSVNKDSPPLANIKAQAKRGVYALGAATFLLQGVSIVLTLLTVRYLTPQDYGLMSLAETFLPYLALISSLNLVTFLIQEKSLTESEIHGVFTFGLFLGGIVSLIAVAGAPFVAEFYKKPEVTLPFVLISLMLFVRSAALVPEGLLKRELQFKQIAILNFVIGLSRGCLQLFLAIAGFGYWALVLGFIYRDLIQTLWYLKIKPFPKSLLLDRSVIKRAISFGVPATLATIFWIIYSTSDNIVVGKLLGTEVLGFYAMAFYLIDLPLSKLNSILRPVLVPYYSRLQSDPAELKVAFLQTVSAFSLITFPIIAGFGIVSGEGVPLFLGKQWQGLIVPLQIMAVIGVLRAATNNTAPLFLAIGKPKYELYTNLLGALFLPPVFFFLAKEFGLYGIYGALLLFLPLLSFIVLLFLKHAVSISVGEYLRKLFPATFGIVLMTLGTVVLAQFPYLSSITLFFIKVLLGALLYGGTVWLLCGKEIFSFLFSLGITEQKFAS